MKNIIRIIILVGIATIFGACQIEALNSELSETIYVRHKGADMPAYVRGNPDSKTFLVVLHGAGSFGLAFRDGAFTSQFEDSYVVVYFDQRGQGMSQGHYSKPDDLIDLMASDVEALTNVLKHKYGEDIELFLMGHSWGGLLSASALLRENYQNTFQGWINVDGLMDLPAASQYRKNIIVAIADEHINRNKSVDKWQSIKDHLEPLAPDSESDYKKILLSAANAMNQLLADETIRSTTNYEKLYRAIIDNNPITWQVSYFFNKPVAFAREMDYSVLSRLNEIHIPTLFIYGKYDVSVPFTAGFDAYNLLGTRDKKFVLFEASAHHPHNTEPGNFAEEVRRFINLHK